MKGYSGGFPKTHPARTGIKYKTNPRTGKIIGRKLVKETTK